MDASVEVVGIRIYGIFRIGTIRPHRFADSPKAGMMVAGSQCPVIADLIRNPEGRVDCVVLDWCVFVFRQCRWCLMRLVVAASGCLAVGLGIGADVVG